MSATLAPLGRLLWSRRLALPAFGLTAMGGFLGWIGAMVHFDRLPAMERDAFLPGLVAASALVMLPAAAGLLAGDALQQLARRPSLRLMPALRARVGRSLALVAGATSLLVALAVWPFRPDLDPLRAAGPAALGFALGAQFPGRARSLAAWAGAFLLALLAEPLSRLAASPFGAAGMLAASAGLLASLVARLFRPGAELRRAVTWLLPMAPAEARREAARRPPGEGAVDPPERILGLRGWRAAHRFEQATAGSAILTPGGLARLYLLCVAVALIAPALRGLSAERGFADALLEALVGPTAAGAELGDSVTSTFVMILAAYAAVIALVSAAPLLGSLLYPISRRQLAELAWSVGQRWSLAACALSLGLGGLLGLAGSAVAGRPWPTGLPNFAWTALVGYAAAPWVLALWLVLAGRLRRRQDLVGWALFVLGMLVPVFALRGLWSLWVRVAERELSAPLVLTYAAALGLGWAVARPRLRRHFARCDLVG